MKLVICSWGLSGCQTGILHPEGPVGVQEASLLAETFGIMLIVVLPVLFMTVFFAWRYRATSKTAVYAPDWSYNPKLELTVWAAPFIIVLFLGYVSWRSTHRLDPYRRLDGAGSTVTVEVVALNWKWLFIYPDLHIASINQLVIPVNTQIDFKITSDTVMNVFFIPQLGSQIYAMSGMQTQLHLLAKNPGNYRGISANFSGDGFADMRFATVAVSADEFAGWVKHVQANGTMLDSIAFQKLEAPSQNIPVRYFGNTDPALFGSILMNGSSKAKPNSPESMN